MGCSLCCFQVREFIRIHRKAHRAAGFAPLKSRGKENRRRWARLQGLKLADLDHIADDVSSRMPSFKFNLFVQYKRPEFLKQSNAIEWSCWKKLHVDDARSWFASTKERFDLVQMSMIDTFAATGAGAFSLSENGLYTLEGWRAFLKAVNNDGIFTVSRWYNPGEINETGRMIGLAMAA
jgi:hypothetical protein